MSVRSVLSVLLPFFALAIQWLLWPWISPFVWFLFFPAVFFSARLGGLRYGLISTVISAGIVWFFFIPPQLSWSMNTPNNAYSVIVFLIMGYFFSDTHERLRSAQKNLENTLQESRIANEKITTLYQKTLELDELKSQFFANISHELRTPLTLIMSPLVQKLATADLSPKERSDSEMMLRNVRLLYRHVSDLLDAARLESGRMAIDYARTDLAELTRVMASHFDSLAKEKGIDYRIDTPAHLQAEADAEKVQRILLNLLSNAFKFTPDHGRIVVSVRQQDNEVVIEVQDNGPGIPVNQREAVFERFRQVEGTAQRRHGGTGLGLAIVREFAELHHGHALVTDAPDGPGALFMINLPLHAPAGSIIQDGSTQLDPIIDSQAVDELHTPQQNTQFMQDSDSPRNAPLVLIVEDNEDMRIFIANTLHQHYRVICALDGQDGLEQAMKMTPDLILCDIMMPRMSGDQMVAELRQYPALAEIPVIILTAKADDELRVRLFKIGVQGYLNKPFSVEELLARVESLIRRQKQTRQILQLSDKRFNDIVNASADWVWEIDADSRYIYASESVFSMLGYHVEEMLGKTFFDLMPSQEADRIRPAFSKMCTEHAAFRDLNSVNLHKDGNQHFVQSTGIPIFSASGQFIGYRGLSRDITQQKLAEEQLRHSEERLRLALDATCDGLWDWDIRNDTAYLAPHYYEMSGYAPDKVTPNYAFFKHTIHPDDLAHVQAIMDAHMRGEIPVSEFDYRLMGPSGEMKWVRGRGKIVERDETGQPQRMIGTITDISAQKAAEELLHHQTEELAQQNAELSRFNHATVGRELDMIALKQQVNALSIQLGKKPPFSLAFDGSPDTAVPGADS